MIALIALAGIASCTQVPMKETPNEASQPVAVDFTSQSIQPVAAPPQAPVIVDATPPAPQPLPPEAASALGIAPVDVESTTSIDPPPLQMSPLPPPPPHHPGQPAPPKYADVWEHLRAGFKLPDIDDEVVRKWENFYASRPEYWERINERGRRYLYFICAEIEQRGMPMEIALLPIIESAYNPSALSKARASGIWQFIPATGKLYGLHQNWWLDNRRDVTMATAGALDYLERLHEMFGDWQLALASYNWGEGSVQRARGKARAQGLPADYASIRMPGETRNYLPKLQAVKNIVMNPSKFGLTLPPISDRPYFTTLTTARQIDVALAAKLAGMPIDEFRTLNPAHNRPVIAGGSTEQRINVPSERAASFAINLNAYTQPLVNWRPYQLKKGERLENVAPKFGIDIDELKRVNGLDGHKRIAEGFALLVPARGGEVTLEQIPTAMFREAPAAGPAFHKVKRGETLASIAQRYGVSVDEIRKLNRLSGRPVAAGTRLRLQAGTASATKVKGASARSGGGRASYSKPASAKGARGGRGVAGKAHKPASGATKKTHSKRKR